jgi:hypothetical protein
MHCGKRSGGKAPLLLAVTTLLAVLAFGSAATPRGSAAPPRATHIGGYYVLTIPQEAIDPGDRRPR